MRTHPSDIILTTQNRTKVVGEELDARYEALFVELAEEVKS